MTDGPCFAFPLEPPRFHERPAPTAAAGAYCDALGTGLGPPMCRLNSMALRSSWPRRAERRSGAASVARHHDAAAAVRRATSRVTINNIG